MCLDIYEDPQSRVLSRQLDFSQEDVSPHIKESPNVFVLLEMEQVDSKTDLEFNLRFNSIRMWYMSSWWSRQELKRLRLIIHLN